MTSAAQLGQLSSAAEIVTDFESLAAYEVDESRPSAAALPYSVAEVADVVRLAATQKVAIIPCGGRTKLAIGAPPTRYELALDLSRLNRVLTYDPRDLTLGVEPGITLAELSKTLAAENQFLPLAPPYSERATIGGIVAANVASPLRQAYGGPRDFVLGMEFVTGYGAKSKSGGRVVKNVTGYDLHKLLIGSLGTLAVITRINFKTFPLPPAQSAFVVAFDNFAASHDFCAAITRSPLEPAAVEIISPAADTLLSQDRDSAVASATKTDRWSVMIVAAGNDAVVARHGRDLRAFAETARAAEFIALDAEAGRAALARAADFPSIAYRSNPAAAILRISALPASMPALVDQLTAAAQRAQIHSAILIRPYGLIYFALLPQRVEFHTISQISSAADHAFSVAAEHKARAFVEFAPADVKRRVSPWGPVREDLELMRRVKRAFDPENVLSPGRFVGGI